MLTIIILVNLWLEDILLSGLISLVIILPCSLIILRFYMSAINRILSALNDGFHNFLDNDFSVSLAKTRNDELGDLVQSYNSVGEALRNERMHLYQRELLLDTVIQTTPLSLILTDDSQAIIYSNSAARKLLFDGKVINGSNFFKLLKKKPRAFKQSIDSGLSGLFTVSLNEVNETYHLTQNQFLLNGRKHQLYLFKSLTKEISRQEVNTWKKVIRLISHELNNSLAPISSLAHSGKVISRKIDDTRLERIFNTVEERAKYLQSFIEGYAKFARLPKPQFKLLNGYDFMSGLRQIIDFNLICEEKSLVINGDPAQLQQVMINLLKNAHESGSAVNDICLSINQSIDRVEIQIKDRGKGMTEKNLSNALLPFYSTKSEGTGLGLPLCREITEAHNGKMLINNRKNGGLKVTLVLPDYQPENKTPLADSF